MKNVLIVTALLGSLSFAAADSLGLSGTYNKGFYKADGESVDFDSSFGVGLSYTYDLDAVSAVRAELELLPNLYGSDKLGFGGEFTYLRSVMTSGAADVYLGGGLGLTTVGDSGTSDGVTYTARLTAVNPTLLAGVRFAAAPGFSAFAELAGGPSFLRATVSRGSQSVSDSVNGAFLKPRLGFTYTLR
ncbi:hypothetical protein [Deinococcus radiotolerans]|uniref:hypothetical protein n=1 Tax=Deinococcus radiotolerans TaxID=1309407 RepID=UPI001665031A|nr:hypothetical protein [Deinococcus radiotolerans]